MKAILTAITKGIGLEFDGRYESIFCYKSKNYAFSDGGNVTVCGSALRSRGTEPVLRALTNALIHRLIGVKEDVIQDMIDKLIDQIIDQPLQV